MSDRYRTLCDELKAEIPAEMLNQMFAYPFCELDDSFLGFIEQYQALSVIVPREMIVVDCGCHLAAQSWYFKDHRGYIGVDKFDAGGSDRYYRITPPNGSHYFKTIQDFIAEDVPQLFKENDPMQFFAICNYVNDSAAVELVRKTFPSLFCFYPPPS